MVSSRISHLVADKKSIKIAGLVIAMRVMKTKRGDTMGFITLDDRTGRMEVAVFADTYNEYRGKHVKDALLIVEGQVSNDDYSGGLKMRAAKVTHLEEARQDQLRSITVDWNSRDASSNPQQLVSFLENYRVPDYSEKRGCDIVINYQRADAKAALRLSQEWRVIPVDDLLQKLRDHYGNNSLKLSYDR